MYMLYGMQVLCFGPPNWLCAGRQAVHVEPYGPHAGMAAVQAARQGDLELHRVSFSYPLRPNTSGPPTPLASAGSVSDTAYRVRSAATQAELHAASSSNYQLRYQRACVTGVVGMWCCRDGANPEP